MGRRDPLLREIIAKELKTRGGEGKDLTIRTLYLPALIVAGVLLACAVVSTFQMMSWGPPPSSTVCPTCLTRAVKRWPFSMHRTSVGLISLFSGLANLLLALRVPLPCLSMLLFTWPHRHYSS